MAQSATLKLSVASSNHNQSYLTADKPNAGSVRTRQQSPSMDHYNQGATDSAAEKADLLAYVAMEVVFALQLSIYSRVLRSSALGVKQEFAM